MSRTTEFEEKDVKEMCPKPQFIRRATAVPNQIQSVVFRRKQYNVQGVPRNCPGFKFE